MPRRRGRRDKSLCIRRKKGRYQKKTPPVLHDINLRTNKECHDKENIESVETENVNDLFLDIDKDTLIDNENDQNTKMEMTPCENDDNVAVVAVDNHHQNLHFVHQKIVSQRWSIFHLFVFKYNAMDAPDGNYLDFWKGKGGVIAKIRKDLGMNVNSGFKFLPLFERILECIRTENDFDPSSVEKRGGVKTMTIRMDGPEAQIVADGLESGLSVNKTWRNVNKHRHENGAELISESCVQYTLRKMKPKLVRIKKRKKRN